MIGRNFKMTMYGDDGKEVERRYVMSKNGEVPDGYLVGQFVNQFVGLGHRKLEIIQFGDEEEKP